MNLEYLDDLARRDKKVWWWVVIPVLLALSIVLGATVLERQNRHEACIEALKSSDVGDLARHDICTH